MKLTHYTLTGLDYLTAVTDLAQRVRLESPAAGLYEAADFQWWWREDDATHPDRQIFWRDDAGVTVACLRRYDAGDEWQHDFILLPSAAPVVEEVVLPSILPLICLDDQPSMITVREDDLVLQQLVENAGFTPQAKAMVQTELVGEAPPAPLKPGFSLTSRAEVDRTPHPMIKRNGPHIARKLSECSLYRSDLDLSIRDVHGTVAAYALFWMDPVTKVGLLEPMRTERPFQRLGLASHLIAEGTRRLRALGAATIKLTYSSENEAAARLYHQCGFQDRFKTVEYRHEKKKGERVP